MPPASHTPSLAVKLRTNVKGVAPKDALGVVTARNPAQWARTFGRLALGHPERSPFAKVTQGKKFRIRFDQKVRFELDGGARPASKKMRIKVRPGSVTVCVPPGRRG